VVWSLVVHVTVCVRVFLGSLIMHVVVGAQPPALHSV